MEFIVIKRSQRQEPGLAISAPQGNLTWGWGHVQEREHATACMSMQRVKWVAARGTALVRQNQVPRLANSLLFVTLVLTLCGVPPSPPRTAGDGCTVHDGATRLAPGDLWFSSARTPAQPSQSVPVSSGAPAASTIPPPPTRPAGATHTPTSAGTL